MSLKEHHTGMLSRCSPAQLAAGEGRLHPPPSEGLGVQGASSLGLALPAGLLGTASPGHEPAVNVHVGHFTQMSCGHVCGILVVVCRLWATQQDCAHNPSGRFEWHGLRQRCQLTRQGEHFRGTPGASVESVPDPQVLTVDTNPVIAPLSTHPTSIRHPPPTAWPSEARLSLSGRTCLRPFR